MSLCQYVVEDEEVEGMIGGGARVVADGGVYIGEWAINIRGGRRNQGSEAASEGHRNVSFLKFWWGIYSKSQCFSVRKGHLTSSCRNGKAWVRLQEYEVVLLIGLVLPISIVPQKL